MAANQERSDQWNTATGKSTDIARHEQPGERSSSNNLLKPEKNRDIAESAAARLDNGAGAFGSENSCRDDHEEGPGATLPALHVAI